jgi:ABC-type transport system involved in multi-copper enzyme maturation permease subunit
MPPATPWLLRTLRWSNSRQAYLERGGALALLAGVGLLLWYGNHLSTTAQVAAVAALLLSAAVFLRRGWLKLFGPVLFYDMIRAARRGRYFLMRFLYAAVLFFVLLSAFANARDTAFDEASAAEAFFDAFLAVQLIAVSLLTPAYVAGSVTEEKERKTLEYLLATDLRNREIVLSKLLSRLANLTLFLLTGLPILSMVQFLGGVDPTLVLIGFALTLLTMLGVGGLSVLFSTLLRRSRDAIAMTYLAVIAYLALSFWSLALPPEWANENLYPGSSWKVGDVLAVFNEGNLGYLYARIQSVIWTGVQPEELWWMITGYAVFQGVLFAICTAWAVLRLRTVALKESQSRLQRRRGLGLFRRPRVGSDPMLWKEVHIDGRFRLGWLGWAVMAVVLLSTLVPGFLLFFHGLVIGARPFGLDFGSSAAGLHDGKWGGWSNIDSFQREANVWVRIAGTGLASIALLGVAVRAAGSVSGERERQTLDGLLASPLDSREVFFGKWVGSVLSVRWLWTWLLLIWGMGCFMGGLLPFAVPLLVAAWLAYAAAFAQVGLFFSMASRSSMRATVWTILVLAGVCFGHWLPWMCCGFGMMMTGPGSGAEEIIRFQAGLTPPVALAMLAFCHWDFHFASGPAGDEMIRMVFHSGLGVIIWGMAALFLWASNQNYFRVKMNRDPEWLTTANRGPTPPRLPDRLAETELAEGAAPRGAVLLDETWEAPRAPRTGGETGNQA